MKLVLKIAGAIAICLMVALVCLRFIGLEPRDRTPGLWLRGSVTTDPVSDWSFTDAVPTVKLQTETWYLLPHSVNIGCFAYNKRLYVASVFPADMPTSWSGDALVRHHVRIKVGDKLYERNLVTVTDPAEKTGVLQARATKFHQSKLPDDSQVARVFRVDE